MAGSRPMREIYFFTISAIILSDIAVFLKDIFFVKPLNTGPSVIPEARNHCCKARTASNGEPDKCGIATTAP